MRRSGLLITALALSVSYGGCGSPTNKVDQTILTSLSYRELFIDGTPAMPVDDGGFALPANAAVPDEAFEGRLDLVDTDRNGIFQTITDSYGVLGGGDSTWKHLPPFSFEFVQDGSYLIPAQQGLFYTGHPRWNYIVGPGRVWKQNDDSGYTRASFPFALIQKNQNCVHNGVMTFLFSNSKSPNVSHVRYQITQETCAYAEFNLWGQIAASYTPYPVAKDIAIKSDHAAELIHRLPTKPLSVLTTDFPDAGVDPAALIGDYKYLEGVTTYGLFINGVNYVSGCQTRFGEYSFCGEMRLPSYSTSKSAFNSVAMMRLGQLYGNGVYNQLIRDYVPECIRGGDWTTVTFDDGLDMATGNFLSAAYLSDEGSPESTTFSREVPYVTKIDDAIRPFPHQAPPGTTWVYQDVAAFITTQAMNHYLQQQRGSDADIFSLVRDDVYKPMEISEGGLTTMRTDNSEMGKPMGYMGLFYTQDDIAKIAKLLNNDNGVINGSQILDPTRLQETLYRNPSILGLPIPDTGTPSVPNTRRYNNSFWAKHVTQAAFPQYSCDFWVPYMSGAGGITIALLPNGATFYVFGDHNEADWASAAHEANKLAPFCH